MPAMIKRHIEDIVLQRMDEEPVIALHGPRAVGKTTLLRVLAARRGGEIIDLDDLATRDAVADDPSVFARAPGPVFIDEFQHVPAILDAIKAELNRDGSPGRFVITGSTRHDALPVASQALTGRLHRIPIYPFSQSELGASVGIRISELFDDPMSILSQMASRTSRRRYGELVTAGGFPMAVHRASRSRNRWFDDYITQCLERDATALAKIHQKNALPFLLRRLASQTAQILNIADAAASVGLTETTAENYTRLLEDIFLVQRLPAWGKTLTARSVARPKIHIVDSGLAARLLGITSEKLMQRDPTSLQQFGHLLETFVTGEILKLVSLMDESSIVGHWRSHDGHEVDLVIERDDGAVLGFEIKAGRRVGVKDRSGMRILRDKLGGRFVAGFILCAGERSYTSEDRIHVVPIDHLWVSAG